MKNETLIWTILFVAGSALLAFRTVNSEHGVGSQYVVPQEIVGMRGDPKGTLPVPEDVEKDNSLLIKSVRYGKSNREAPGAVFSLSRTVGIWVAALLTLCVFSYLYRDNVFYKFAESIIVGVSAGYWIVLSFWTVLVDKILVKLAPEIARATFLPDTPLTAKADYWVLIPTILGCMIFFRLVPKYGWLGRWPLAVIVGTTAGLKLILFLNADFIQQIRSTILPLVVFTGSEINWKQSVQNTVLVFSVLSSLTYFYFSIEHKGIVGRISRAGIWVLMISFGASFALTVMGRITLLTMRLQFLFDDWLGLLGQ